MTDKQKQTIIQSIKNQGCRVTAADISAKTGIALPQVNILLNKVAAETGSTLEVSKQGTVVYKFSPKFESIYALHGIQLALQSTWSAMCAIAFFLFRISFGIMLILSMVIIVIAIIICIIAMIFGDKDSEGLSDWFSSGSGSNSSSHGSCDNDWSFIFWNNPTTVSDTLNEPPRRDGGNFLTDCYSFLFGDGNPNIQIEERKMQFIAQLIQENHGVVTAEELAPYLGSANDDAIFSVLARFEGQPEVSEGGNIVYSFPALMKTSQDDEEQIRDQTGEFFYSSLAKRAKQRLSQNRTESRPDYLHEFIIPFSSAPGGATAFVIGCAVFNLIGSSWLCAVAPRMSCLGLLAGLSQVMLVYGILFVCIPIGRAIINGIKNSAIEKRNSVRRKFADKLAHPSKELRLKLQEAKVFAIAKETVAEADIVYTTDKDALEQEFDNDGGEPIQMPEPSLKSTSGALLKLIKKNQISKQEEESQILHINHAEKIQRIKRV